MAHDKATPETAPGRGRPRGFGAFAMIWSSQLVSILASGMSGFALTIWMYERTKSATAMAAVQVFYILPFLAMSFFAGPMIDRYNRKLMMAVSDICAAIGTFSIFAAFLGGFMETWMIYASAALMGLGNSFQWPAFSATISLMVPKAQLGRVNGMMSLMEAGPAVFAPILAGIILPLIGIKGILAIDIVTFFLAIGALLVVEVPEPGKSAAGEEAKGNIIKEALWGFKYIFDRPSLLGLQLFFFFANFAAGIGGAVVAPMILARTNADSVALGGVQTAAAIGAVAGGLIMSAWGGFKRRTFGIASGWVFTGLTVGLAFGLARSFWPWAIAIGLGSLAGPIMNASSQSIWQSKVPPDMQGRVFSARRLIAWFAGPVTPLIAGPLADFVLEPAMRDPASGLARVFGPAFGVGPGAGMGLLVALSGLACVGIALVAWSLPAIRDAESRLPDHDAEKESPPETGAELGAAAALAATGGNASVAEMVAAVEGAKAVPEKS
jgi:MFS family permease